LNLRQRKARIEREKKVNLKKERSPCHDLRERGGGEGGGVGGREIVVVKYTVRLSNVDGVELFFIFYFFYFIFPLKR